MDLRIVPEALWYFKLSHYNRSDLTFCLVSLGTFSVDSVAEELWDRSSLVRLSYGAQFPKQIVFYISIILIVIS